ncbi:MAG: prepilin-type N-terminal cleavage/methylation domain-containing protein [Desulfamplus sp.]|nr:prepilin-type N-terminal cleavage/methylation domain-containing protein [Desulfamplus sp.]
MKLLRDKNSRGFTLLEIMVSLFILAIVLVSVFKMHSATIRLSVAGDFYATASHLARYKLADIERDFFSQSYDQSTLNELSGDFEDKYPGYRWQSIITTFDSSTSQIPENLIKKSELQKLKRIIILIFYGEEFSFELTSWRFVQNG